MLTPPKMNHEPIRGEIVDVIEGIPIYRTETPISGGGVHVYFHTACNHEPGGVWKTSTKAGAVTWRWRCDICRRYYGQAISKSDVAPLAHSLPAGPSMEEMRDAEHEAQQVAQSLTREAEAKRKEQEQQQSVEYTQRYHRYLETPAWKAKRDRVMRRAGGTCEACGVARATEVHHLTYERVFEEPLFDLVAICGPCHRRIHEIEKERRR